MASISASSLSRPLLYRLSGLGFVPIAPAFGYQPIKIPTLPMNIDTTSKTETRIHAFNIKIAIRILKKEKSGIALKAGFNIYEYIYILVKILLSSCDPILIYENPGLSSCAPNRPKS